MYIGIYIIEIKKYFKGKDMKKMRTDTVMGEDLEKIFKKLNKTVSSEETKSLEEQKIMIQRKFEEITRKRKMKQVGIVVALLVVSVVYFIIKTI